MPAPSSELEAAALLVFPTDGSVEKPSAGSLLVRVTEGFVVRQEAIGALVAEAPGFTSSPVMRRQRGHDTSEPMGGHTTPFVALDGSGHLLMATERCLEVLHLRGGFVYVKEGSLVGFESTVRHEHGRFSALGDEAVSMVQLSGRGLAVF